MFDKKTKEIILEIIQAYDKGENIVSLAKDKLTINHENRLLPILLSYDLQAGSYNKNKNNNLKVFYDEYGHQLAEIINTYSSSYNTVLEVGCGECTSLSSILKYLKNTKPDIFGFDLSWSRIYEGKKILNDNHKKNLFVADLFSIPLQDNSINVVYSSHSLEPNGGMEEDAIRELIRVSSDKVILIEPIYELASDKQKKRMTKHGYVKNLKSICESFKVNILKYELLPIYSNPLNQSGVIVIEKKDSKNRNNNLNPWQCPATGLDLERYNDVFFNNKIGFAYPVLKDIPLLRSEHLIIASKINEAVNK